MSGPGVITGEQLMSVLNGTLASVGQVLAGELNIDVRCIVLVVNIEGDVFALGGQIRDEREQVREPISKELADGMLKAMQTWVERSTTDGPSVAATLDGTGTMVDVSTPRDPSKVS